MVRYILSLINGIAFVYILTLSGCLRKLEYPPRFKKGALPDTFSIYKNGYRTFLLDSLVEDKDDDISNLRWLISCGPLLTNRLKDTLIIDTTKKFPDTTILRLVELHPVRNQLGHSYVTFITIDPGGLSASKTCSVSIRVPDFIWTKPTIELKVGEDSLYKNSLVTYPNFNFLRWDAVYTDTTYLTVSSTDRSFKFKAKKTGTTGIYFQITDTLQHIEFHQSSIVIIK